MPLEIVNPDSLAAPKGWNHGVVAAAGSRLLFVAGMAGWSDGAPGTPPGFVDQFARALDQVLEVVRASGGAPEHVARMTVYVTDLAAYRAGRTRLGEIWRERFGRHYPAMALLEVKGLADAGALVEIEATAVLPGERA
jgi:enamine deaminase RidA (YjgF/YER057c/UK114 family)